MLPDKLPCRKIERIRTREAQMAKNKNFWGERDTLFVCVD